MKIVDIVHKGYADNPDVTAARLARILEMPPQQVHRATAHLVHQGRIVPTSDKLYGRSYVVAVSPTPPVPKPRHLEKKIKLIKILLNHTNPDTHPLLNSILSDYEAHLK